MTGSKTVVVPMGVGSLAVEVETGMHGRGVFVGIRRRDGAQRIITFAAGSKAARKLASVLTMAADAADLAETIPVLYTCRYCHSKGEVAWLGGHDCPAKPEELSDGS